MMKESTITEDSTVLIPGGAGFIGTNPGREIEGCRGDCFGTARSAHTHENVELACCTMNYKECYP
jgi:hypothetical protein